MYFLNVFFSFYFLKWFSLYVFIEVFVFENARWKFFLRRLFFFSLIRVKGNLISCEETLQDAHLVSFLFLELTSFCLLLNDHLETLACFFWQFVNLFLKCLIKYHPRTLGILNVSIELNFRLVAFFTLDLKLSIFTRLIKMCNFLCFHFQL